MGGLPDFNPVYERISAVRGPVLLIGGILCLLAISLVVYSLQEPADEVPPGRTVESQAKPVEEIGSRQTRFVWEKWPKPQLALIVTGEQHGYFEPCGCTSSQLGGMSRRADLVKKMTDVGWDVRGVDLGGLARRWGRQAQLKFETTLEALRDLNYIATGLGPEDLLLQADFLPTQHFIDGDRALPFLGANLMFYDFPELGTPVPLVIVEQSGLKLGVTSIISESLIRDVIPEGGKSDISWSEPGPALEHALSRFDEANVDFRILLSHATIDESREFARQFSAFDIVVSAEGPEDPAVDSDPEQVGKTLILQVGRKGKHVGVLGIYPDDTEHPLRFQLVDLERDHFDETPAMIEHMRVYQQRLKDERVLLNDGVAAHPSGAKFVGVDACRDCHPTAFGIWKETPHAHAFESLDPVHGRPGFERLNGVARTFDPECLSCHVTGWDPQEYLRFQSGFLNTEFAETEQEKQLQLLLAGNQCENCHGPGSRHIELVEADNLPEARKQVRVTRDQAEQMCYKCHDNDNSPDFNFEEYWPDVEHVGTDFDHDDVK